MLKGKLKCVECGLEFKLGGYKKWKLLDVAAVEK